MLSGPIHNVASAVALHRPDRRVRNGPDMVVLVRPDGHVARRGAGMGHPTRRGWRRRSMWRWQADIPDHGTSLTVGHPRT